jgi:hypothetical protein
MEARKAAMAQKVTVTLEDDLTGGPAKQTVRFAFDGTGYEIDLNAKNAAAFGKQLAPYIEHARRAGRAQPHRPRRPRRAVSAAVISGPGRKSTAWRSASAAAYRPACWSSTTRRPMAADPSHHRRDPRTYAPRPSAAQHRPFAQRTPAWVLAPSLTRRQYKDIARSDARVAVTRWPHKYPGHVRYRAVDAHDGRNADGGMSRPNNRAPTRR